MLLFSRIVHQQQDASEIHCQNHSYETSYGNEIRNGKGNEESN